MATMTLSEQIQAMIAEQKELKAAAKRVASDLKKCKKRSQRLKRRCAGLSTQDLAALLASRTETGASSSASSSSPGTGASSDPSSASTGAGGAPA